MPDRKPLPLQPSTISDRSAATITSLTNGAQNLHHPGARISVSPPSSSYPDLPDSHLRQLPRLPPELLLQVLSYYTNAAHSRDPTTIRTLQALSCTCKLLHFQALKVRYEVLLLHRHVRDFRTWFRKLNEGKPPFVCAGISRALFSGLDDVSRLTHASTGWETELLRLLHYCGQTVTRLSLWHAESRTVLRDASQVPRKRPRLPNGRRSAIPRMQPGWAWGEGIDFTSEESSSSESPTPENGSENEDKSSDGGQSDIQRPKEGILNREGELDEVQKAKARAEASAARERAKAVPPRWLSSELSSDPLAAHRHRAHLPNEPLETAETSILPLRPPATTSNTTSNDPGDPQPGRRKGARRDNEADVGGGATSEDNRKLFGCSPLYVSICVGSALIEDRLWPRLRLLRRCREIDIHSIKLAHVLKRCHRLNSDRYTSDAARDAPIKQKEIEGFDMTETAATSGPVGPTPIEADTLRTFSHLFAGSQSAVGSHPAAAIRHFKVQSSLDGLPHDILLQIWTLIDDPSRIVMVSRRFNEMGRLEDSRAEWLLAHYDVRDVFFEAIKRPRLLDPWLIRKLLDRGAVLSRALVQEVVARSSAPIDESLHAYVDSPLRWGQSVPTATVLALLSEGVKLYASHMTLHPRDQEVLQLYLCEPASRTSHKSHLLDAYQRFNFTPLSLNTASKRISDQLNNVLPYWPMKPREGGWLGSILMLGDQELIHAARLHGFSPESLPRLSNWICLLVMLGERPFHRVPSKAAKLMELQQLKILTITRACAASWLCRLRLSLLQPYEHKPRGALPKLQAYIGKDAWEAYFTLINLDAKGVLYFSLSEVVQELVEQFKACPSDMTVGILFKQLEQDFSGIDATHQIIVATFWEAQQDSHPVKWIKGRLCSRKVTLDSLKAILFGALQLSALPVEYAFEELGEEAGRQLLVSVIPHLLREDYQGNLLESLCGDCNSAPWRAEAFKVLDKAAQCYNFSIADLGHQRWTIERGTWTGHLHASCSSMSPRSLPVDSEASEDATNAHQEDSEGHSEEDSSEDESSDEDDSDEVDSDSSDGHLFFLRGTDSILAQRPDSNVQVVDMDCELSPNFGCVRAQSARALPVEIGSPFQGRNKRSTNLQNSSANMVTSTGLSLKDTAVVGPSGAPGDYNEYSEFSIAPGTVVIGLVPAKSICADVVLKHTLACGYTSSVALLYRKGVPPTLEHLKIALHSGLGLPDDFFDSIIQGAEFDSGNGGNRDAHSESTTLKYDSRSNAVTSVELSVNSQGAVNSLVVKGNGEIVAVQEYAEGVRHDKLEFATVALRASIEACASLTEQQKELAALLASESAGEASTGPGGRKGLDHQSLDSAKMVWGMFNNEPFSLTSAQCIGRIDTLKIWLHHMQALMSTEHARRSALVRLARLSPEIQALGAEPQGLFVTIAARVFQKGHCKVQTYLTCLQDALSSSDHERQEVIAELQELWTDSGHHSDAEGRVEEKNRASRLIQGKVVRPRDEVRWSEYGDAARKRKARDLSDEDDDPSFEPCQDDSSSESDTSDHSGQANKCSAAELLLQENGLKAWDDQQIPSKRQKAQVSDEDYFEVPHWDVDTSLYELGHKSRVALEACSSTKRRQSRVSLA
ncbi:hypothetical protein CBOM_01480 [Ceraceosorus bombacis]|uniref:F-box domain-containing protein n=1 Tax=Ceraceosorus bombacis TaxID=401625 RepID=A0A0P1BCW0_9BASI|nr:hypothetical protein CBOM_01480 [Ceraceosorus bombacis]